MLTIKALSTFISVKLVLQGIFYMTGSKMPYPSVQLLLVTLV